MSFEKRSEVQFHIDGTSPDPDGGWVFVFGSNEAGMHGKGAAKVAKIYFGAVYGQGRGPTGSAYAIPTKDADLRPLDLRKIEKSIEDFLLYARLHSEKKFFVTRVGCVLAGYSDDQIGPLFAKAPANCSLPVDWRRFVVVGDLLTDGLNNNNGFDSTFQNTFQNTHQVHE